MATMVMATRTNQPRHDEERRSPTGFAPSTCRACELLYRLRVPPTCTAEIRCIYKMRHAKERRSPTRLVGNVYPKMPRLRERLSDQFRPNPAIEKRPPSPLAPRRHPAIGGQQCLLTGKTRHKNSNFSR